MDVEQAASQIDILIERRSRSRDEANALEGKWAASEKLHRGKQRRENREAWAEYHRGLALVHHGLAADNAARADALTQDGSIDLYDNVEKYDGFVRYTNKAKEK